MVRCCVVEQLCPGINPAGESFAGKGEFAVRQREIAFTAGLGTLIHHSAKNPVKQGRMQVEFLQVTGKLLMERQGQQDLGAGRAGQAEILLGEIPAAFKEVILL
ncbi:hypothetical protein D3C85_1289070 [compost metagenome]